MSSNKDRVEAMILVGGRGTRLRAVVGDRPKPMAEVAGRPFLQWLVIGLRSQGGRRVVLCTGHMGDKVQAHLGEGSDLGVKLVYSREIAPLGTAGAVRNALELMWSDPFLVMNGDSYCRFELDMLCRSHILNRAAVTLWLVRVNDCSRYGSVVLREDGEVEAFEEKSEASRPGLISAGIYLMNRKMVESIPAGRAVSLEREVFPGLVGHGLYGVVGEGPFLDIGTPEDFARAEKFMTRVMRGGEKNPNE